MIRLSVIKIPEFFNLRKLIMEYAIMNILTSNRRDYETLYNLLFYLLFKKFKTIYYRIRNKLRMIFLIEMYTFL